ncbi:MAG: TSUP family transporter [Nitrospira sp. CR2.1]|nr:TSUP family transporter [Nitrospira sp. CR2.1]
MEILLIGAVALLAAGLTFFSGFGIGTILMPVFALFFPVPMAIAATAVVHVANNLFKFGLMAKDADWRVVARFGIPAAFAALGGAMLLTVFDRLPVLAGYRLGPATFHVTPVKAVIGVLIMVFALLEFWPRFQSMTFAPRWLPLGGALSGFFGGLSGNQGALRSAFLLKAGLSKEAFVATGIVSAVIVDASRLVGYGIGFMADQFTRSVDLAGPVLVGTVCACLGSYAGVRLLQKVTFVAVRIVVATGMLMIGLGLTTGLL